ncbi:MAG: proprotein convertase P-domain-containing protein [Aequorivita sp.]|nr:proprotein convertase P-domain-containing protein [Aequorivita sp.]
MKIKKLLFATCLLLGIGVYAQETYPPDEVIVGTFIGKTIPLRDFATAENNPTMGVTELKIVPNESRYNAKVNEDALPLGMDPLLQKVAGGIHSYALEENFIGASSSESGFVPPDPTGAVGPNHYVHAVNSIVKIFSKTGTLLVGPVSLGTFLGIGSNSGDPIVLYDQLADRWFVSEFGSSNNSLAIGVSETGDPTGAYNVYQYSFTSFPDYPHYSVWPDAYYLTANIGATNKVYAVERDVMLAGGPNPKIVGFPLPGGVQNSNTVLSPEPANLLGTTYPANVPGYVTYLQDDGWSGVSFDHLNVWEIVLDWNTTSNSTISAPLEIATAPFNSVFAPFGTGDVQQPGTSQKIDMIGGVISFAANYRSFGSHNSWLITFNTDIDNNDTSGIRWIELRNDSTTPWSIYQEGTYAPADGQSRFMGSAAMDAAGNIGLGFNIASGTLPVGIKYTGRFNGDPLGQMTVAETEIIPGNGVQTFTNRFGDYSHLTMDPDNFTFWHTAEYFSSNNNWRTRIASFSLSGGFANDVGVSNIVTPESGTLTNAETVEITIRNYGTDTQTSIPLELWVDGNLVASETFSGNIPSNGTVNYTFAQTVDLSTQGQTYSIMAKTVLVGDEFVGNDAFTKEVINYYANDIGVTAITAPESGEGLGMEAVTVTIENFGTATQSNFDVAYSINGGTPVTENVAGPLNGGESTSYTFNTLGDFSTPGAYLVTATTLLAADSDVSNNTLSATVVNYDCSSDSNNTVMPIGPDAGTITESTITFTSDVLINDVNLTLDINHTYDGDLTIKLVGPDGTEVILADNVGGSGDDFSDTTFDDEAALSIQDGNPPFDGTFRPMGNLSDFDGTSTLGDWTLSILDNANQDGGTLNYWSLQLCGAEPLGLPENYTESSDLMVLSEGNNQFEVQLLNTNITDRLTLTVTNMLGQTLVSYRLDNDGTGYKYNLDMSYVSAGVYFVRLGNKNVSKIKRIIVK